MAQEMGEGMPPPELHPALPNINRQDIHNIAADLSDAFENTRLTSAKTLELDQQEQDYLKSRVKADHKIDLQDRDKLWVALNILYQKDRAETAYLIIRSAQLWSLGATVNPSKLSADKLHQEMLKRTADDPRVWRYLNSRQIIFGENAALKLLDNQLNPGTIATPPVEQAHYNPVELLNELKSLYQKGANGEYIWEEDTSKILVRLTQALNLPPEDNFENILNRNAEVRWGINHPFSDDFLLRIFLENDPQLFERVFNGAPAEIREAAQNLPRVKGDITRQQAEHVLDLVNSQLQPNQLLIAQKQALYEQEKRASQNFHDTLIASDPSTQQEVLKQALVPYLQACNKNLEAGELLAQDQYRSRNKLMESWAGIRILDTPSGNEVIYIEKPSPQSESLLPLGERAKLESLIAQIRKLPADNSDESVDAGIQVTGEIEDLLESTLSKRKELGFVPAKDKTLPPQFQFHDLYHNNPAQKDFIRRIMKYTSPRLQTTFATYEEAAKAYQENKGDSSVRNTYFDHHQALNKALDEEAGLTSLDEKRDSIPDRAFNLLMRKPGVDQTTVGELVEAYIRKRKADDPYQLSKKRRVEKYNEFFADLANKAGLKLEV